jgi:5-methylcytosine-specific restriction protein A
MRHQTVEEELGDDGGSSAAHRNPPWQRDELILALDLYFRHPPNTVSQTHPEVVAVSELLNALPIHANRPDTARFRNPNGVYMKLGNFLRFDPNYRGTGLLRGNRLDQEVWDEFANDTVRLRQIAEAIRAGHQFPEARAARGDGEADEEEAFPEGSVLFRLHRSRERNGQVVKRAKAHAWKRHGRLCCVVCNFDFSARYGEVGEGFIECHHTRPLSELSEPGTTRIVDLALVCSNWHRMIHRKRPWLSVQHLSDLLRRS